MRQIVKEREPRSLTEHRAAAHATYENYADKDGLREALLRDQGGLCCYCMSRIDAGRMKIEHWAAQDTHPEQQIEYQNLLGACPGGQGQPRAQQHCDTRKGNEGLSIHPADPLRSCERFITYRADGTIGAELPEVWRDVEEVLNLNVRRLKENRKQVLETALKEIVRRAGGEWKRDALERELLRWRERDAAGMFREYCQVVVYWLEKRLARASR